MKKKSASKDSGTKEITEQNDKKKTLLSLWGKGINSFFCFNFVCLFIAFVYLFAKLVKTRKVDSTFCKQPA